MRYSLRFRVPLEAGTEVISAGQTLMPTCRRGSSATWASPTTSSRSLVPSRRERVSFGGGVRWTRGDS